MHTTPSFPRHIPWLPLIRFLFLPVLIRLGRLKRPLVHFLRVSREIEVVVHLPQCLGARALILLGDHEALAFAGDIQVRVVVHTVVGEFRPLVGENALLVCLFGGVH